MKPLLSLTLLLFVVLLSCTKQGPTIVSGPPKNDSIYRQLRDCTIDAHYDSARLATALLGTWKELWFEAGGARHNSDSNLHFTFRSDNRYTSTVNSRAWGAGHWRLEAADGEYFRLLMADTVHSGIALPNRVLSCGDGLFLEDAARNGTNQYFVRLP